MTPEETILAQGGRYMDDRLKWWRDTVVVPHHTCRHLGCHGLEGVAGSEALAGTFLAAVHRFDPGDFPCVDCGSTGIVPDIYT